MTRRLNIADSPTLRAALTESFAQPCTFQTYAATPFQPAEHCENHAVDGDELCERHLEDDDPDRARDLQFDQWLDAS